MKIYITILFFLWGITAWAQTMPSPNTVWKVQERETNQTVYPDTLINCIEYTMGDSIFRYGNWYHVLFCEGPSFSKYPVAYLRTEGDKIIAHATPHDRFSAMAPYDTTKYVLYDFGLNVNDTIELKFQGSLYYNNRENKEVYQVVGKDSVQTISGKRLRLKLIFQRSANSYPISGYTGLAPYGDTLNWIEGVGTPQGFYYPIDGSDCGGFFPDSFLHDLICMHTDSIAQYQPGMDCDCVNSQSIYHSFTDNISVYPNPFTSLLQLTIPKEWISANSFYEISSLTGATLATMPITDQQTEINTECIMKGVYLLQIKVSGSVVYSTKIIHL